MRSACVRARSEAMTGSRPTNSGMKPYETRSSVSRSSRTAFASVARPGSRLLPLTGTSTADSLLLFAFGNVAPKPMPVCRVRARIVFSLQHRGSKAKRQRMWKALRSCEPNTHRSTKAPLIIKRMFDVLTW